MIHKVRVATSKNLKVPTRHGRRILIFLINIKGLICNNSEDSEILHVAPDGFDFFTGKDYFLQMTKRILVVEDDTSIRELLVELLESEGYQVASAINGLEGLKYLQSNGNPDLILIDLMMPVMDGYSFRTEQLKNTNWSKIPTVVMSAEANAKEKMKNFHITAFLSKPVELDTILKTVSRYS